MSFKFNNNFIGYRESQHFENFSGSDSKELFQKNLKTKPDDWYYRNNTITYERNTLGHRCKEISEIDLDNYILTIGCSHTEGAGLSVDHTYSHVLSEKFKCDYYNLGMSGTGIDTMMHNLTVWFATVKKQPKFVVMQFPDIARFSTIENEQEAETIAIDCANISPWAINTPGLSRSQSQFMVLGESIKYFTSKVTFARALAKSLITVPIIEVHIWLPYHMPNQLPFPGIDEARDGHYGIMSNYVLAGDISKTYKSLLKSINI
jgi:hypothetical protein